MISTGGTVDLGTGRMSTFGGPDDIGVGPDEGLALVEPADLDLWWFGCLFLPEAPKGTTGLARRLNPAAYYLAMRWDYARFPKELLRNSLVRVSANGRHVLARPVDFGPGDGTIIDGRETRDTGRVADLSPGVAEVLGLSTDQALRCELIGTS